MSALGLPVIDEAVHAANRWIDEVDERMDWDNKQKSYRLLRAVLHAVRDHLGVDEAVDLGAQLPIFIRGVYFESWDASKNPRRMRTAADFAEAVQKAFRTDPLADIAGAVTAVMDVLDRHVSEGEMAQVRAAFTGEIRKLFDAA